MIIYGIHPVMEVLESETHKLERILIAKGKRSPRVQRVIELARNKEVAVRFESMEVLRNIASTGHHQQVVAVLAEVSYVPLENVLEENPSLVLVVDSVQDPRNLGAVLRTAEAAGVQGVLIPDRRSCGLTPAVFKSSSGGAAHLKIARIGNVVQALRMLKEHGLWIVGLDLEGTARPDQVDTKLPLGVVVGGEHRGVRKLVRKHCDWLVSLPMQGCVSSLNLSVATGILLYQIVMQRERRTGED